MSQILIIGFGDWATIIGKILANNVINNSKFNKIINIYANDEDIGDNKLSDVINKQHVNRIGLKLPDNVVAVSDVVEIAKNSDIIFFALPLSRILKSCKALVGHLKSTTIGVLLTKGFYINEKNEVDFLSHMIKNLLKIDCCVFMGPTIVSEVAEEKFCEAIIGSKIKENGLLIREALQTNYLRIKLCEFIEVIEACGALKDIVAIGAGLSEGLGMSDNTGAAVIRLGLMEIIKFCRIFCPKHNEIIFLESFAFGDLVAACNGSKNYKVALEFSRNKNLNLFKDEAKINEEEVDGPEIAREINVLLKTKQLEREFPLFTSVYNICFLTQPISTFIDNLKIILFIIRVIEHSYWLKSNLYRKCITKS